MAPPFQPKLLIMLSLLFVTISFTLSSTVSFVPSSPIKRFDPHSVIHVPSTSEKEKSSQLKTGRQQRTIMEMMKDGNVGNIFNMANIFKLNGTQFSWVPLGSLLFNNNGNIFGG